MRLNVAMNQGSRAAGFIKKGIALVLLGIALGAIYLAATHRWPFAQRAAQQPAAKSDILYWYDAMNPQSHYNKPGKAPDGMDLVPMMAAPQSQSSAVTSSAQLPQGAIVVPAEKQALAGVRTALVERKALAREIHTTASPSRSAHRIGGAQGIGSRDSYHSANCCR